MNAQKAKMFITVSGRKKYARNYTPLLNEEQELGIMENSTDSKIKYQVAATIPQVFGDFSSLKVEVGVEFPGDPGNLLEEVDKFDGLMDEVLTTKVNHVLKAQGKEEITL